MKNPTAAKSDSRLIYAPAPQTDVGYRGVIGVRSDRLGRSI